MAQSEPLTDLVAAVSDALNGDASAINAVMTDVRERATARARGGPSAVGSAARLPAAAPRPLPEPQPDRAFQIRLANGRRLRATIAPTVAHRGDLARLARISAENDRRAFRAISRHRRAIHDLRRSQQELAASIKHLQNQTDRVVVGLVQGVAGLERQVRTVASGTPAVQALPTTSPTSPTSGHPRPPKQWLTDAQRRQQLQQLRQAQEVKTLAFRAQVQNVANVVNTLQTATYSDKGSLFTTNNMLLAGNQLFWSLLEPVLRRARVLDSAASRVMTLLAPLGGLVTGQVLLAERQHERYFSGVATTGAAGTYFESLRSRIGERYWSDFRLRRDIVVTAKVIDPHFMLASVYADVDQGSLRLFAFSKPFDVESLTLPTLGTVLAIPGVRIAWTVDIGVDVG